MNSEGGFEFPAKSETSLEDYSLYWGTLHNHSTLSWDVVQGTPQKIYRLAMKDGLHFCSITEHDSPFGVAESRRRWRKSVSMANQFYKPGEFVTFIGYEWTSGQGPPFYQLVRNLLLLKYRRAFALGAKTYGHKNVYFPGDDVPERAFAWNSKASNTPPKLWSKIAPYMGITITHHPLGGPTPAANWECWDPKFEPLVEIFSQHGNSESEDCRYRVYHANLSGTHSVRYALDQGYILGFVAGTDSHRYTNKASGDLAFWLRILKSITRAQRLPGYGLTGVYADSLTRESIWDALLARRTFATTGARIIVSFTINGSLMGRVIEPEGPPQIWFRVEGTDRIDRVEVIKNGRPVSSFKPAS
ncbi:MAG: DUF3604 domain-containing protein, partial [Anaerolineae bacterium]